MAAPILADLGRVSSWITDHHVVSPPCLTDIARVSETLSSVLAAELTYAQEDLSATAEELLLAALGRAIARTIGDGVLSVDVDGDNYLGRVALRCASRDELTASEMLTATGNALRAATPAMGLVTDISFGYRSGSATPSEDAAVLALNAYHDSATGDVVLDWSYDARSFDPYTIEELVEQFPMALIEVTSEAADG